MCCLLTALLFIGPRGALALWWIFDMARFNRVYDTFIWPFLGFIFLPFATLMWTLVWIPGVGIEGFNWVWIGLAVVLDIISYGGGGYSNRNRIPGMSSSSTSSSS